MCLGNLSGAVRNTCVILQDASVRMSERVQVGSRGRVEQVVVVGGDVVVRVSLDVRLHYHLQQGFQGTIQSLLGLN